MKKNITTLLITVLSLFSFQQSYANIAEGETGTCIWYITDEGELVIAPMEGSVSGDLPENGWGWGYDNDGNLIYTTPWYGYKEDILSAKILPGVNATSCCCMFVGLSKAISADLSGLNTQNVTDMSGMFFSCSALTSLDLSNFNTQNVTYMNDMFSGCSALTSLDLSNFDTQNVRGMNYMFNGCSTLTSLDLSNFDTQNVRGMSYMFNGCSSLTSLDLSNFNTQNVTNMYGMFCDCSALTSLDLTNFNMQNVTDKGYMFSACPSLTTIISDRETPSPLKVGTFSESFDNRANCTLRVPAGSKALYAAADGWNELGRISDGSFEFPEDAIAQGETGTCVWYITDEGELVIAPVDGVSGDLPENGWILQYDNDGNIFYTTPWYGYREDILSVKVMPGVNATSCRLMYAGLSKVVSADLSGLNTQNVTNTELMFGDCSALTSLDLSSFNTQNVTGMRYMFSGCSALTSLDLSNFNTQNVTDMYGMFCDCSALTSLDLTNFNMQNVENSSGMFSGCPSLTTIISDRETPSPLKVGTFQSFENRANCTLRVPAGSKELYAAADGWNELGRISDGSFEFPEDAIAQGETGTCVWYITDEGELVIAPADGVSGDLPGNGWDYGYDNDGNIFYTTPWYSYREDILSAKVLPGVNATSCRYMFVGLSKAISADLSGLNTQNVTDMNGMFDGCSSLTSLDLSNFDTQNVTSMGWMFNGCSSLTSLDLSNFDTQNVTDMSYMFYGCSSLTSLDLSNFNTQNVTDMSNMFSECSALTSLNLSNFDTRNVTRMGLMFVRCSALTSLDLSNFDTLNVTSMDWMFLGCSALTSLDLSNFNTQNVTRMYEMFGGCSALTSLDLSNFDTQNVTSMGWMFNGCSSLTSLDLSNFDTQNVTDMSYMFYGCSSLTSLDLSNFNTQNVTDMSWMFRNCSALTSLDLSNFNTQNVTNMSYMFYGCSFLTSLDLSNFDTQNVTDTELMFSGCSSLASLDLSNFNMQNVENFSGIFSGCSSLTTIISKRETPSSLKVGTFGTLHNTANCTLAVPAGSVELYAAADGWNELGHIMVIDEYLFGNLKASVSEDENIATDALAQLQLTFPDAMAGKPGFESYVMSNVNMDVKIVLRDSESGIVEESYALTIDSIGTVEFGANLKRGETYTVEVPRGLYTIFNNDREYLSPATTLTYTTDYILGDVNDDKQHSVTDIVGVVSYIIKGSEQVGKLVVDCNIDNTVNIADASYLVEKVITGEFPSAAHANARLMAAATTPQLRLTGKGKALALSFDGSDECCSMQFDVTLKDNRGDDITSADNIRITPSCGLRGHSITAGMVDGKLRVVVYSIDNSVFGLADILTVEAEGCKEYTVSITDAVLVTTGFDSVYPDDAEASVSVTDAINELSPDDAATEMYDITGRKINVAPKNGLYIIGGKKVMK